MELPSVVIAVVPTNVGILDILQSLMFPLSLLTKEKHKAKGRKWTWQSHRMFGTPFPFQNSAPSWYLLAFKSVIGNFFFQKKKPWRRIPPSKAENGTHKEIPFQITQQKAISSAKQMSSNQKSEREVHKKV